MTTPMNTNTTDPSEIAIFDDIRGTRATRSRFGECSEIRSPPTG